MCDNALWDLVVAAVGSGLGFGGVLIAQWSGRRRSGRKRAREVEKMLREELKSIRDNLKEPFNPEAIYVFDTSAWVASVHSGYLSDMIGLEKYTSFKDAYFQITVLERQLALLMELRVEPTADQGLLESAKEAAFGSFNELKGTLNAMKL